MELAYQIFAIIFYILFLTWLFLKIRNLILIKKMNFKEMYKNMKKECKKQKISKYLFILIIILLSIFALYIIIWGILWAIGLFMMSISLGGVMYVDTGTDSTFYDNLIKFINNYSSLLKYVGYFIYVIIYIVLIRASYINITIYKNLKSNDTFIKQK